MLNFNFILELLKWYIEFALIIKLRFLLENFINQQMPADILD